MSDIRFPNGSKENQIFKEAYAFAALVEQIPDDPDAWAEFIRTLNGFAKKYGYENGKKNEKTASLAYRMAEAVLNYACDMEEKRYEIQRRTESASASA